MSEEKFYIIDIKKTSQVSIQLALVRWPFNELTPFSTHLVITLNGKPKLSSGHYYKDISTAVRAYEERD